MTTQPVFSHAAATDGSYASRVHEMLGHNPAWASTWRVMDDPSGLWLRVVHDRAGIPDQGWKLHVSATVSSAEDVLQRVLPILLDDTASFKVARARGALAELNAGYGSPSQVGKFVTVYPHDDDHAVRLAVTLSEAAQGLHGPRILTDRQLTPVSPIYYRYGSFRSRHVRNMMGAVKPAILTPDGVAVPDERGAGYRCPEWAVDPFVAAGVAREIEPPSPIVADRYLALATLYRSTRCSVHLAIDLQEPSRRVLKRGRRHGGVDADGRDATERLRHEFEILSRLAPDPRFPAVYDLVEEQGDVLLVMEDIEGATLEEAVRDIVHRGQQVPPETIIRWVSELDSALAAIHARGILYRDLKSINVIVTPDGHVRLLDFDAAFDPASGALWPRTGTLGYMSPGHVRGDAPTVQDDIYGLGAVLYFMATGVEPSNAPNHLRLLDRPVGLLNPTLDSCLISIIEHCLHPDAAQRYRSADHLLDALQELDRTGMVHCPTGAGEEPVDVGVDVAGRARVHARALGDTLCAVSHPTADGAGRYWLSTHGERSGFRSSDLNTGNAGTLLALAELVDAFNDPDHREMLKAGARALIDSPRPEGPALAGLYVGESGVGAALLRAGQVLHDPDLIEAACAHGRLVATMPWASPDLFNGTAGRLRFLLWLWDETGSEEHLRAARTAGECLIDVAEREDGLAFWKFPEGFENLTGQAQIGYAHGAAGIADALLDLFDATRDGRYRDIAVLAGRWITSHSFDMLDDNTGANWPVQPDGDRNFAFWCHGAAGVGRFLLHLGETGDVPDAKPLAARAARTVAHGTRWAGPTQCHGLAGNIEFLVDMYQATGDEQYLADARVLGHLLLAFAVERDGLLMYPSESSRVFTPDYMVGYAGVAIALLRLADPLHRPHQLSRKGFRYRSPPDYAGEDTVGVAHMTEVIAGTGV